jgi:hypothetical protein
MVADHMTSRGSNNTHTMGELLVAFTPSMARTLASQGWSRERIQQHLWAIARRRIGEIRVAADGSPAVDEKSRYEWWPDWVNQAAAETLVPVTWSPEDIHVLVTGADSIPSSAIMPSWGHLGGFAITRALPEPARQRRTG